MATAVKFSQLSSLVQSHKTLRKLTQMKEGIKPVSSFMTLL